MLCFRKDLDYDHYGLKKLKKRVLEYLAVRQIKTTQLKGPILCFVGPPGVGKTSIGRSIATTLGREFHRYQGQCHFPSTIVTSPSTIVTSPQPLSPPCRPLSSPLNHCHLPSKNTQNNIMLNASQVLRMLSFPPICVESFTGTQDIVTSPPKTHTKQQHDFESFTGNENVVTPFHLC